VQKLSTLHDWSLGPIFVH
jgi:hypothetical protein